MGKRDIQALKYGANITVDFKGEKRSVEVSRTVGGMVWPGPDSPGYYLIFGQDTRLINRKRPLHFLAEFESADLDCLLENLVEEARQLMCRDFFGDALPVDSWLGYHQLFCRFADARAADVRLYRPRAEWMVGVQMLKDWAKSESLLNVKGSILGKQLGQMTKENLQESERPAFYAVDALRCIMDEVERVPWNGPMGPTEMPAEAWT